MSEAKKPNNAPLFIGLGAIVAIALAVVLAQRLMAPDRSQAASAPVAAKPAPNGPALVTDAERAAYIQSHVRVEPLLVDPDTQIGPEGTTVTIAGLLKVHGTVKNGGDKAIDKLILILNPVGSDGAVVGSYREDVSLNRRLGPNEERAFEFRIPDKKEFSGEYQHRVE